MYAKLEDYQLTIAHLYSPGCQRNAPHSLPGLPFDTVLAPEQSQTKSQSYFRVMKLFLHIFMAIKPPLLILDVKQIQFEMNRMSVAL